MGCGCKNKGNQTPPPSTQQTQTTQTTQSSGVQTESVKNAVRKTIEKYYNVKKSNGWVKE